MNIIVHHDLKFDEGIPWQSFLHGTCSGYFGETEDTCEIFTISNTNKGNGDFRYTIDWFSERCKQNGKYLEFSHIENDRLMVHLTTKLGFEKTAPTFARKKF